MSFRREALAGVGSGDGSSRSRTYGWSWSNTEGGMEPHTPHQPWGSTEYNSFIEVTRGSSGKHTSDSMRFYSIDALRRNCHSSTRFHELPSTSIAVTNLWERFHNNLQHMELLPLLVQALPSNPPSVPPIFLREILLSFSVSSIFFSQCIPQLWIHRHEHLVGFWMG